MDPSGDQFQRDEENSRKNRKTVANGISDEEQGSSIAGFRMRNRGVP